MILDTILAHKREEIAHLDLPELKRRAASAPAPRDFIGAFTPHPRLVAPPPPSPDFRERGEGLGRGVRVSLIAEVKFASPSRGVLLANGDAVQLAQVYASNGAAALSILTDEKFFRGSLHNLSRVRAASPLPLLRKDFIISPAQVYEARAAGADAILLIAAALPDDAELADLHALAIGLGMSPLVEVHTRAELERVLQIDPILIGINNRDLHTFNVSLDTTATLRPLIPANIAVVSESGIFTPKDMARLAQMRVDAALIGEALVTAPDIGAKVRELTSPLPLGEGSGVREVRA
ncbi:MAG TPA: indole-3-glycerol phosphate synthase TrpC [Anaerolineae bacterium]|nr:indole-3-glycerol phosphate synthase TrpC [Anaerolineae bacterium]